MTAWKTEREAIINILEKYGGQVFATVLDSYDYERALNKVNFFFKLKYHVRLFLVLLIFIKKKKDYGYLDPILEIL